MTLEAENRGTLQENIDRIANALKAAANDAHLQKAVVEHVEHHANEDAAQNNTLPEKIVNNILEEEKPAVQAPPVEDKKEEVKQQVKEEVPPPAETTPEPVPAPVAEEKPVEVDSKKDEKKDETA